MALSVWIWKEHKFGQKCCYEGIGKPTTQSCDFEEDVYCWARWKKSIHGFVWGRFCFGTSRKLKGEVSKETLQKRFIKSNSHQRLLKTVKKLQHRRKESRIKHRGNCFVNTWWWKEVENTLINNWNKIALESSDCFVYLVVLNSSLHWFSWYHRLRTTLVPSRFTCLRPTTYRHNFAIVNLTLSPLRNGIG